AKAVDQGKLDEQVTEDDRQLFLEYLINWGILSESDLKYEASDHRGYTRAPDAFSPGEIADPYPFADLVPFAASTLGMSGGYLAATATFDWQTTLVKPKEGMTQLYEEGFGKALGDRVHLNCEVTEIRQDDNGVRIVYKNKETGEAGEATGDYCLCNMPLSVLVKITADFSDTFKTAIRSVPYAMATRTGLGFNRRFWEQDDWIYGGQSFSNIPELGIIDYPDSDYGAKKGAILCGYNFGVNAARVSSLSFDDRVNLMLDYGSRVHPDMKKDFQSGFSVAWHLEPYSLGAWPSYTPKSRAEAFPILQEPDGRVYLVGEHLSYVNAWIEGAVQAAWMQVAKLDKRVQQGA
ncbi:MAG: flavin monoamine oxidase family protein, partial [Thermomicrobiales bacterium]